jgi:hypothetical protein
MERLQQLINQLQEQLDRKTDPSQMLQTVRLLEAELSTLSTQAAVTKTSAKVAVMMPSSMKIYTGQAAMQEVETVKVSAVASGELPKAPEVRLAPEPEVLPLAEIPTMAQQQKSKELNDVIGNNGSSLNDKLRSDILELKSAFNETPIRDLKKAIGVNDRYVFISQLFRGDEVMYERSLKTINGFRILPEAEYWMERELKVKLGWDENRDATKQFYQLVRRRFS